ncbi:MAG: endonuclease domain-containing protein [Phenylobacterium sp.]|uniref:endonuclease domain-containing protein n=1 Tax=Phenylobacterium sp. TaxID=1871053 RepID=UPI00391BFA9A
MTRLLATRRARALRADQTRAEACLWRALRDRRLGGWKWRRQVPCGPYILDFLCAEARLVVELDGSQHAEAEAYDARRTRHLAARGLTVLRFWNGTVLESRSSVCDSILAHCSDAGPGPHRPRPPPPPPPLPRAGEDARRAGEGEAKPKPPSGGRREAAL